MKKIRVSLPPEERKEEIINAAEKLFYEKGYSKVTINDIIKDLGIVKGTFYYHFKNKKEVRDIIINRYLEEEIKHLNQINESELSALEKLSNMIFGIINLINNEDKVMHDVYSRNPEILQELVTKRMNHFGPLIIDLVDYGIEERVFKPQYYEEAIQFLLINMSITIPLIHYTLAFWDEDKAVLRLNTIIHSSELVLGAKKRSLDFISDKYWYMVKEVAENSK